MLYKTSTKRPAGRLSQQYHTPSMGSDTGCTEQDSSTAVTYVQQGVGSGHWTDPNTGLLNIRYGTELRSCTRKALQMFTVITRIWRFRTHLSDSPQEKLTSSTLLVFEREPHLCRRTYWTLVDVHSGCFTSIDPASSTLTVTPISSMLPPRCCVFISGFSRDGASLEAGPKRAGPASKRSQPC